MCCVEELEKRKRAVTQTQDSLFSDCFPCVKRSKDQVRLRGHYIREITLIISLGKGPSKRTGQATVNNCAPKHYISPMEVMP